MWSSSVSCEVALHVLLMLLAWLLGNGGPSIFVYHYWRDVFLYGYSLLTKMALLYDGIPSTSASQWDRIYLIWHSQKRRQLFHALLCLLCVFVFLSALGTSFDLVGFFFCKQLCVALVNRCNLCCVSKLLNAALCLSIYSSNVNSALCICNVQIHSYVQYVKVDWIELTTSQIILSINLIEIG